LAQKANFVHHGVWYTKFLEHIQRDRPSPRSEELCNRVDGKIRDGSYKLPVLPQAAAEVLQLSRDANVSIDRVVKLLDSEPALTARLLATANSPLFRGRVELRSGKEAVVRLGLRTVCDLVMQAVAMSKVFEAPLFKPQMVELKVHATCVAFACRSLEAASPRKDEWAFMAGLLHGLGKATLLAILSQQQGIDAVHPAVIDEVLALRHAAVGAVVVERMKLSDRLAVAIARHHDADAVDPADVLPRIVAAGHLLANAALGARPEDAHAFLTAPSTQVLGLHYAKLERLVAEMAEAAPSLTSLAT
jgi:HD-like signal output (HDOD) protein